jgi:nitrogen fixation NifU-like protein
MMCELLKDKSYSQALEIAQEFSKMMTRQEYDCEILGDACALEGINKLLPRIKCATLAWSAAKELLTGEQKADG